MKINEVSEVKFRKKSSKSCRNEIVKNLSRVFVVLFHFARISCRFLLPFRNTTAAIRHRCGSLKSSLKISEHRQQLCIVFSSFQNSFISSDRKLSAKNLVYESMNWNLWIKNNGACSFVFPTFSIYVIASLFVGFFRSTHRTFERKAS